MAEAKEAMRGNGSDYSLEEHSSDVATDSQVSLAVPDAAAWWRSNKLVGCVCDEGLVIGSCLRRY